MTPLDELIRACLSRMQEVTAAPHLFPTFFREELGLKEDQNVSSRASQDLGGSLLHFFLEDELLGAEPALSPEQIWSLLQELRQRYGLRDHGLAETDLDQERSDWDPAYVLGLLEETATAMFARETHAWSSQGGMEQLLSVLRYYRTQPPPAAPP